jgi:phage repressor protein C with HTH and peptisase S24 domain
MNEVTQRFIETYNKLIEERKVIDQKDFATSINVSTSMITEIIKGRSNVGLAAIQNTVFKYNINSRWLLTGNDTSNDSIMDFHRIPLVSVAAVGGFGNADFAIKESDVKDFYVVPKFRDRHIDFMIEISGSSMQPKYNSGDVVACTIIRESNFIQWNKVHVIGTTEQGILIKRLRKGSDPGHLLAVSDNKEYDPFEIPLKEIVGLAIVVGVIRLE